MRILSSLEADSMEGDLFKQPTKVEWIETEWGELGLMPYKELPDGDIIYAEFYGSNYYILEKPYV